MVRGDAMDPKKQKLQNEAKLPAYQAVQNAGFMGESRDCGVGRVEFCYACRMKTNPSFWVLENGQ